MEKELSNLSLNDQNNEAQLLKEIILKASSHDINVQLEGIKEVKNAASQQLNPPIDQLVTLGIIPILVDCLKKGNEELALAATSILAIIASRSSEWAAKITAVGAVPELIELLSSPNESLCERIVQILGHMIDAEIHSQSQAANECYRQRVLDYVLKSVTPDASSSFVQCVSQIFVSSWRLRHNTFSMEYLKEVLPVLLSFLTRKDVDTLIHSTKIISSLADAGHIDPIIESGIIRQLVPFLSHNEEKLKAITVYALGNIITGTDEQTQAVLDEGVLQYFPELLLSKNEDIVKSGLWFLSNICAGNRRQIQAVLDAGLIPSIINVLDKGSFENRKWAAWAVCNISQGGTAEQIMILVDKGLIPSLCHLLTLMDNEVLMAALETMKNIIKSSGDRQASIVQDIKRYGVFASVQLLEKHDDYRIHKLASDIKDQIFPKVTEEGEEAMNFEENC